MFRFTRLMLTAGVAVALVAGLSGGAEARTSGGARAGAASPPSFSGVQCVGGSFCVAAGDYSKPGHANIPLVEDWNGRTWRIMPLPRGFLGGISCGGPAFCLGSVLVPHKPRPVVAEFEWNGRTWLRMKDQPPSPSITCFSPAFCVTVTLGLFGSASEWNGKIWQGMPDFGDGCGGAWCTVDSMDCASATICFDSGSYCTDDNCDGEASYAETWNGADWAQSNGGFIGEGSACAGRSFCLSISPPSSTAQISFDRENTWHDATANLAAVCRGIAACRSPANLACGSRWSCVALLPAADPNLALAWNGATWRRARLALVSGHLPKLTGLSCGGARNCVAIGRYQPTPRSIPRPVAEHWNGKTWQVTALPTP